MSVMNVEKTFVHKAALKSTSHHGQGNGNLLQYSCLGNPIYREACQDTVQGVEKESDMT